MDRDLLAQLMTQNGRPSQNVEQAGTNWPAFMAEQMRNIPTLGESNPTGALPIPPPMGGQLGQLGNSAEQAMTAAAMRGGPQRNYVIPNPDQPPYDPTYDWNRQHR